MVVCSLRLEECRTSAVLGSESSACVFDHHSLANDGTQSHIIRGIVMRGCQGPQVVISQEVLGLASYHLTRIRVSLTHTGGKM